MLIHVSSDSYICHSINSPIDSGLKLSKTQYIIIFKYNLYRGQQGKVS